MYRSLAMLAVFMAALLPTNLLAAPTAASAGTWTAAPDMAVGRAYHTATLLPTGKVLVTGGRFCIPSGRCLAGELFDPSTDSWAPAGSMTVNRAIYAAVLLKSGQVLAAGGLGCAGQSVCRTAELYDPTTGAWTATGSMLTPRLEFAAARMKDGRVLVSGGQPCPQTTCATAKAEIYDPSTDEWAKTGTMLRPRRGHTLTLLQDGTVLAAGGHGCPTVGTDVCKSAEIYNPKTGKWTKTASMHQRREGQTATLLKNGTVLVVGGEGCQITTWCASAEIYNPKAKKWTLVRSMHQVREDHTATRLANGTVLVTGGQSCNPAGKCVYRSTAEVYSPGTGKWTKVASLRNRAVGQAAVLLPDHRVLVTGGVACGSNGCISTQAADIYRSTSP